MTESEWSLEEEPAPKKKGIPKWVWFGCGGGCLLAVVLTVLLSVVVGNFVKEALDPEAQWPKLARVLPFDERPEGVELYMGLSIMGQENYTLIDKELRLYASVLRLRGEDASQFDQLLEGDLQGTPFGLGQPVEPEKGEAEVQGRVCRLLRFSSVRGQSFADDRADLGPGMWLDLSSPSGDMRLIQFRRMGSEELISDADVQAFLEPFDVWRSE